MPTPDAAESLQYDSTTLFAAAVVDVRNRASNGSIPNMYLMDYHNDTNLLEDSAADLVALDVSKDIMFYIRLYTLPVIGLFGVIGNVLSVSIFLGPKHRNTSCSLYLAAKSVVDTGFIVTLFLAWLDFIDIRAFHVNGVCQLTVFASYVCSFFSVCLVVCITAENYIRICRPTQVNVICTPRIAQCVLTTLFIFSFVIYNLPLWALQVQEYEGRSYCLTLGRYKHLELILTYIDTSLTLVLPLLVIMILLFLIFCNAIEATKRENRLRSSLGERHRPSYQRPHIVVTRLLSAVSIMFLVLHTPLHVIRIKVIIESFIGEIPKVSHTDRHLQHIFVTMYYMNFSFNCLVYLLCGRNYRRVFLNSFCKCCSCNCTCEAEERDDERFSQAITMNELIDKDSEEARLPLQ